jgi:hypothetical protein
MFSSRSRRIAAVSTSSRSEEPPWRSRPSTTCPFGRKPGRRSSVSREKRFGSANRRPSAQTPRIATTFHGE